MYERSFEGMMIDKNIFYEHYITTTYTYLYSTFNANWQCK
jgi:hypothetical protein